MSSTVPENWNDNTAWDWQKYNNIEMILIDDGAYDGTEKICDRYADIDSRIKVKMCIRDRL